jgi:hypothetical protein
MTIDLSSSIVDMFPRLTVEENPVFALPNPMSIKGDGVLGKKMKKKMLNGIENIKIMKVYFNNILKRLFSMYLFDVSFKYVIIKIENKHKTKNNPNLIRKIHDMLNIVDAPKRSKDIK